MGEQEKKRCNNLLQQQKFSSYWEKKKSLSEIGKMCKMNVVSITSKVKLATITSQHQQLLCDIDIPSFNSNNHIFYIFSP